MRQGWREGKARPHTYTHTSQSYTHPHTHTPTGGADVLNNLKGKDGTADFHEAHGTGYGAPQKKLARMEVKVAEEILAQKFKPANKSVAP